MSHSIDKLMVRLEAVLEAIDWQKRDQPIVLKKPADEAAIAALEEEWGRELPPSYAAFLRRSAGFKGLEQFDWGIAGTDDAAMLVDFQEVAQGFMKALAGQDASHPALDALEEMPTLGADFDRQIVYVDQNTWENEEPRLRLVEFGAPYEERPHFQGFEAFLAFVVSEYEKMLELQREAKEDVELSKEDEQLLNKLSAMLGSQAESASDEAAERSPVVSPKSESESPDPEIEPEPEPEKLSPEVREAAKLCHETLQKLLDADLIELVVGAGIRDELENYMLKKLMRSNSPEDTMDSWIYALSKAREVEELYGTDEQLKSHMRAAFEEAYARKQG